jgi:hypothetical protein
MKISREWYISIWVYRLVNKSNDRLGRPGWLIVLVGYGDRYRIVGMMIGSFSVIIRPQV